MTRNPFELLGQNTLFKYAKTFEILNFQPSTKPRTYFCCTAHVNSGLVAYQWREKAAGAGKPTAKQGKTRFKRRDHRKDFVIWSGPKFLECLAPQIPTNYAYRCCVFQRIFKCSVASRAWDDPSKPENKSVQSLFSWSLGHSFFWRRRKGMQSIGHPWKKRRNRSKKRSRNHQC